MGCDVELISNKTKTKPDKNGGSEITGVPRSLVTYFFSSFLKRDHPFVFREIQAQKTINQNQNEVEEGYGKEKEKKKADRIGVASRDADDNR